MTDRSLKLAACPTEGPWHRALGIRHGPADLLWRFFAWADAAARQRDVALSFASFEGLLRINEANQNSWHGLVPLLHPVFGGVTECNGFVLLGRNSAGAARAPTGCDTSISIRQR